METSHDVTAFSDPPPLPSELRGIVPRSVPPEMWDAPAMVATRRAGFIFFAVGVVMVILGFLPIMKTWALYVLPLAYLIHAGVLTAVVSVGYLIRFWATGGNLRYVEKAHAAMALIQSVSVAETELNGVITYAPHFTVLYRDHDDQKRDANPNAESKMRCQDLSASAISADKLAVSNLRLQVGDWTPVVWFPGKADTTATLYESLNLNESGIWTTDDNPVPTPLWLTLCLVALGGGLMFSLFWSLWAMGAYSPIEAPPTPVIALSIAIGFCIAATMAGLIYWNNLYDQRRNTAAVTRALSETNSLNPSVEEALPQSWWSKLFGSIQGLFMLIMLTVGGIGLPSLLVYEFLVTANALLDDSEGTMEIAELKEMIQVTHGGIFREYKIDYRLPARGEIGEDQSMISNPDQMSQFQFDGAVAVVKPGALGWEWVSELIPIEAAAEEEVVADEDAK